jgi:4-amino-4-deoxy-L-arabinose transferase-like glycosyltransferase
MPTTPAQTEAHRSPHADVIPSRPLTARAWWLVAGVMLLLLVPTLFYPIGPDQGMFLLGGEKILRGAIHYRDIVDVKPPIIYYVYAAVAATLGTSEISIRIFDLLLQAATILTIITLVRRCTGHDRWAAAAGISYALFYLMQEYQSTAQVESFVGLLGLGMLWLLLRVRSGPAFLAVGLLAATLFLLKFTLGIMLAAALAGELLVFGERPAAVIRNVAWMAAGFLAGIGAFIAYLLLGGALHGFLLMQQFTQGYVRTQVPSLGGWAKNLLETFPLHASEFYSFLLLALTVVAMMRTLPIRSEAEAPLEQADALRMARLCAISSLLLAATLTL